MVERQLRVLPLTLGQAGDPVEVQAASSVFRKMDADNPLIIGSVSRTSPSLYGQYDSTRLKSKESAS